MDNTLNHKSEEGLYKVAVATSDGIVVNQHFGRAASFYIYEVMKNGKYRFLHIRTVTPVCNRGDHDDNDLQRNISEFKDCKYILVSRIGPGAANMVEQSGIIPMELPGMIEDSINKLIAYEEIQNLF